jgi:hypothetical protein
MERRGEILLLSWHCPHSSSEWMNSFLLQRAFHAHVAHVPVKMEICFNINHKVCGVRDKKVQRKSIRRDKFMFSIFSLFSQNAFEKTKEIAMQIAILLCFYIPIFDAFTLSPPKLKIDFSISWCIFWGL